MRLSDERIAGLATAIAEDLAREELIHADPSVAERLVRQAMIQYVQAEQAIDAKVREKIGHLKRTVIEGSREWEILYRQYYDEELKKHI